MEATGVLEATDEADIADVVEAIGVGGADNVDKLGREEDEAIVGITDCDESTELIDGETRLEDDATVEAKAKGGETGGVDDALVEVDEVNDIA
jgi:hypothetical protein